MVMVVVVMGVIMAMPVVMVMMIVITVMVVMMPVIVNTPLAGHGIFGLCLDRRIRQPGIAATE